MFGKPGRPRNPENQPVQQPQQMQQVQPMQQVQQVQQVQQQPVQVQKSYAVWELGSVAVQTEAVIVNPSTGETLQITEGIVKILNYLEELKALL